LKHQQYHLLLIRILIFLRVTVLTHSIKKGKQIQISQNSAQTQREHLITLTRFGSPCVYGLCFA